MGVADRIIEKVKSLPEEKQTEVLNFVDFLEKKIKEEENRGWSKFSLESAMRGMEDEKPLYTLNDLKETFS
ncbi:hypothetical protein BMS3Abin07_00153 [bacterium BMS3Abin07]|nr:hypothetical protein BMS3Abin07_00153 [bacterium BMS3Abin07]GBE31678.1 hypothetical protein BMS3Bbin05_00581 [bacterium BMS3Bbin05]